MKGVVQDSFKLNLAVMKIFGYCPSYRHSRLYKIYALAVYFFAITPNTLLGFIEIFIKNRIEVRHNDFVSICVIFLSPKLLFLLINGYNIEKCIKFFDMKIFASQNREHSDLVKNCVKTCQRNSRVFFIGCAVTLISWCGKLIFFERGNHQLPLNVWLPFSLREVPIFYDCLYLNLVIGVIYVGLSCAAVDPLIAGLICHASVQVQVLKRNLQLLDKPFNTFENTIMKSDFVYKKIKKCVIHYNAITEFVKACEQSFSWSIFFQLMDSIILIGICCLQLSKMKDFDFNSFLLMNYLGVIVVQVYFYCYYGAILIEENNSLTTAIYMSNWYNYNTKSQKALIILMERSKRPLIITAGKVLDLSLETFMLIMKRSYSFLAVLKN